MTFEIVRNLAISYNISNLQINVYKIFAYLNAMDNIYNYQLIKEVLKIAKLTRILNSLP